MSEKTWRGRTLEILHASDLLLVEFFALFSLKRAYEHAWGSLALDLVFMIIWIHAALVDRIK